MIDKTQITPAYREAEGQQQKKLGKYPDSSYGQEDEKRHYKSVESVRMQGKCLLRQRHYDLCHKNKK